MKIARFTGAALVAFATLAPSTAACPEPDDPRFRSKDARQAEASQDAEVLSIEASADDKAAPAPVDTEAVLTEAESAGLSTFVRALERTGLDEALSSRDGPVTIFAPSDEAFAGLTEMTRNALASERNTEALGEILRHHVVGGRYTAQGLLGIPLLATIDGAELSVDASFGGVNIENATIIDPDLEASGSVIHVVDQVLIPKDLRLVPDGPLMIGVYVYEVRVESRLGLRVSRLIDGGNAGPAGVLAGDVIVSFDGMDATIRNAEEAKADRGYGNDVKLLIFRDGEIVELSVPVGIIPR